MQVLLNDVKYNVTKKDLPWGGKVDVINKIHLEDDLVYFLVKCNSKSPEQGRYYTVVATSNSKNKLTIEGYSC